MTNKKFGFKTFIQVKHPIAHPRRPFNKVTDLKAGMPGLWVYLTATNLVAKRATAKSSAVTFVEYVNASDGELLAHIYVHESCRFSYVSLDRLYTKADARPNETQEAA